MAVPTFEEYQGNPKIAHKAVTDLSKASPGTSYWNVANMPGATFDQRFAQASVLAHSGGGTIVIEPRPDYVSAGLPPIYKPTVSILGPGGSAGTVITLKGPGPLVTWAPNPYTVTQMGGIQGVTLASDGSDNAVGLHCIDTGVMPGMDDLVIGSDTYGNFNGAGAVGMKLENTALWNERASGRRVDLNHNTIGMQLVSRTAFNSFFYHRWLDLRLNVGANQIGIQTVGTALLQGGDWHVLCNVDGNNGIAIDVGAGSVFGGQMFMSGEQTTGTGGLCRRIEGIWAASGTCNLSGCTDSVVGGAMWPPFETFGVHVLSLFPSSLTASYGAAAGTSPPARAIGGNDFRGIVFGGTGSATTVGDWTTVTFGQPFQFNPFVQITPFGVASGRYRPFISAVSTTSFTIAFVDAPAPSLGAGDIGFFFTAIG